MKKLIEIRVRGIVQGVGFRPFVHRLARAHAVSGYVLNDTEGVVIRAEGTEEDLEKFLAELPAAAPPLAMIMSIETAEAAYVGYDGFSIERSRDTGTRLAFYSPDAAVCPECLAEFFDPADRRYGYPFITCINCGPRFSIVDDIPYDRKNTSMDRFTMCDRCLAEYEDPADRRYHSQPNACPACGPRLLLRDHTGKLMECGGDSIAGRTVALLKRGAVVAIKGIGGYHLAVDARNDAAVSTLRERKRRPFKPFAIMAGSLFAAEDFLHIGPVERELLTAKERPIVLVKKKGAGVSGLVAPGLSWLGIMLPCMPFQHHLFSLDPGMVLVMTSGNVSDEPIEYRDEAVFERLGGIADYFVTHDREIIGQGDDSVISVVDGAPYFIRRSRGYVPAPLLAGETPRAVLAVGGDIKNSFAIARKNFIMMSQYLGDMADPLTYEVFRRTVRHFIKIFDAEPTVVAADPHPAYLTRQYALDLAESGVRLVEVQHHHAHVASVMEENGLTGPVIGIAFDGTGYGADGALWGGEFLLARRDRFERAAHFSYFPLPGGESAIRDVWKIGLSLLHRRFGRDVPALGDRAGAGSVFEIIEKKIQCPLTCSIGRIFDGIAAILGISSSVSAEAEAAQLLEEAAARGSGPDCPYIIPYKEEDEIVIDTDDLTGYIASLLSKKMAVDDIAAAFHHAVIHTSVAVARRIRERTGVADVALSGGAFQNRILLGGMIGGLADAGFAVYTNRAVPCNDGGIALGQLSAAKEILKKEGS